VAWHSLPSGLHERLNAGATPECPVMDERCQETRCRWKLSFNRHIEALGLRQEPLQGSGP